MWCWMGGLFVAHPQQCNRLSSNANIAEQSKPLLRSFVCNNDNDNDHDDEGEWKREKEEVKEEPH